MSLIIHPSSIITYDDVNKATITINAQTITYGLDLPAPQECRNQYTIVQNTVDSINFWATAASDDFSYTTNVRRASTIGSTIPSNTPSLSNQTVRAPYYRRRVQVGHLNNLFDLTNFGYCIQNLSGNDEYVVYQIKDIGTLTEPSTPESRLTNWRLERSLEFTTDNCADLDTFEIVQEEVSTTTTTTTV